MQQHKTQGNNAIQSDAIMDGLLDGGAMVFGDVSISLADLQLVKAKHKKPKEEKNLKRVRAQTRRRPITLF